MFEEAVKTRLNKSWKNWVIQFIQFKIILLGRLKLNAFDISQIQCLTSSSRHLNKSQKLWRSHKSKTTFTWTASFEGETNLTQFTIWIAWLARGSKYNYLTLQSIKRTYLQFSNIQVFLSHSPLKFFLSQSSYIIFLPSCPRFAFFMVINTSSILIVWSTHSTADLECDNKYHKTSLTKLTRQLQVIHTGLLLHSPRLPQYWQHMFSLTKMI